MTTSALDAPLAREVASSGAREEVGATTASAWPGERSPGVEPVNSGRGESKASATSRPMFTMRPRLMRLPARAV